MYIWASSNTGRYVSCFSSYVCPSAFSSLLLRLTCVVLLSLLATYSASKKTQKSHPPVLVDKCCGGRIHRALHRVVRILAKVRGVIRVQSQHFANKIRAIGLNGARIQVNFEQCKNAVDNTARIPLFGVTVVTLNLNDGLARGFRSQGTMIS
jgi:hypothetical protein